MGISSVTGVQLDLEVYSPRTDKEDSLSTIR